MPAQIGGRRIVNIINFVRGCEPRQPSRNLVEPVAQQLRLLRQHELPGTFLLQYDALMQDRFVDLFKSELDEISELGVWLEIVEPLAKAAGIPWRGRFPWDWHVNVGFSIGYTPAERERLIDVLMHGYRAKFGTYPASFGSWFFDAHTLAYAHERYGVEVACCCRDQVGTDGYTLWGGYYSGGYYPSRVNSYMPAQHAEQQIPVPVFRMLGSDPIYQYDIDMGKERQGVMTLEPSCYKAGGNPEWVRWFFNMNYAEPMLNLNYAQVGQENSFGWETMSAGITDQFGLVASLAAKGQLQAETLSKTGRWFRANFSVTPATAVTALEDWQQLDNRSVWYNSRFYRVNLFWEGPHMRVRDIHLFDETLPEQFLTDACATRTCEYETLPVLDGFLWSTPDEIAGIRPVILDADGNSAPLSGGDPQVTQAEGDTLLIHWPLENGGVLQVRCAPDALTFSLSEHHAGALGLEMSWASSVTTAVRNVLPDSIQYEYAGHRYSIKVMSGCVRQKGNHICISAANGSISLSLQAAV